jgi:hypothetical protein
LYLNITRKVFKNSIKGIPTPLALPKAMMFLFFNSWGRFSKMDKNKCPFLKTWGRNIKKTMHSSLRA